MTNSVVTDMNLGQNGGAKQSNGAGGGRRKTKGNKLTEKKHKEPRRGMSMEQLERIRVENEESLSPFNPNFVGFTTSGCTSVVPNVAVHYRPAHAPSPAMLFHGIGIYGSNLYSSDHGLDPAVIGSSNVGFRFENYMKCGSDCCGVCHKKKRINGGCNPCSVNPFRNGNNTVVEMMDAGKTRRCSGQVTSEVMSVHRNGVSSVTAYEFFPAKGGGADEYKDLLRMGSTPKTTTWCGRGSSVSGAIGFRGGEGSCVTAETGSEEGNVSSLDLSLKLSY